MGEYRAMQEAIRELTTERDALQARLDAVSKLADEWDEERAVLIRNASVANEPSRFTTRLRAALAPVEEDKH